ncbi:MAG: PH domain-containing protein [Chloroflexi bacterium]|nr:PH domain-containing protein [Chloroflexota bacterium]
MGYVERLLAGDETVIFHSRQHWIVLTSTIVGAAILALLIMGVAIWLVMQHSAGIWGLLLLVLLVWPIARAVLLWVGWVNYHCLITNRRVIEVSGVLNKTSSDSLLENVTDIILHQSFLGRMLNYGSVEILTPSGAAGENIFDRIADPIAFKLAILEQKRLLGR